MLAEISDKMPSTAVILFAAGICSAVCIGIALTHRAAAWGTFVLAGVIGIWLSYAGVQDAFIDDSFENAVWNELGWPYVIATIVGPLLPLLAVMIVLVWRPRISKSAIRGFAVLPQ